MTARPDPILESLYELSVKNRDAQFSCTKRLTSGLTERRYVGCVDVDALGFKRNLRHRGVDFHDFGVEQGTDPNNVGFVLRVLQHERSPTSCVCQPAEIPKYLLILVLLLCLWKLVR